MYRAGVVGLGCIVEGVGVQGGGADLGVQGLDVEDPGVQVLVMQGSWVAVLGVRESAGRVSLEEPGWGHSLGPEQSSPSQSLCSCVPGPQPQPLPGQGSIIVSGPWGTGGKQVKFNGEWRVGRGKPCEAAGCHCSVSGSVGPCLWFTCAGLWSLPVEGPLAPGGRCTAQARAQERPRPNLDSVWGQVVSGHCHRAGAPWSPPFVGLLPPPRRKLKWK